MAYPTLVSSYLTFCGIKTESEKTGTIDLSNRTWFYPTTLLPLGNYIKNRKTKRYISPSNQNVNRYIRMMFDPTIIDCHAGQSYIPLINLPKGDETKANRLLSSLYPPEDKRTIVGGKSTYTQVVGELVDNVYQHSEFNNSMVMAQRYAKKKIIEVCIFDDGISISGSYKKHLGRDFNGVEAILQAINGLSTRPEKGRGRGLHDTVKLVSDGMRGEIMIISGDGILHMDQSKAVQTYILSEENDKLNGTLFSARIPFQRNEVKWYEYIK